MGKELKKIVIIFLITIIAYGIAASVFTITVHAGVDEALYLAMAQSFHYNGKFAYGNQLLDYSCVLYSMLISIAYFFYSPQWILLIMRMMGVIMMSSSIFPIYFLAKDVLGSDKDALKFSAFMMLMPYMFDSAYIMQEVLSYPLFIWTVYFLYRVFEKENHRIFAILGAVFSVLCVFAKTYMFFIPFVINICSLYYAARGEDKKKYIVNTMIYNIIYLILFAGMYFAIFAINGFERGTNHYDSQFSQLFPININTIIFGVLGCVIYWIFFVINMGIFPVVSIAYKWKSGKRTWLASFLLAAVVFLTIETVLMIVLTEQQAGTLPQKFLFRYFQIFVPLTLMLFINDKENFTFLNSAIMRKMIIVYLGIAALYFAYMGGATRQSIIDGHLFLLVENLTKYIMPKADVLLTVILMICTLWMYRAKIEKSKIMKIIIRWGVFAVVIFDIIQFVQLPYYTNIIADGKTIQSDSIKIAEYLNAGGYEMVYYVYDESKKEDSYLRNFCGYIKQPHQIITEDDLENIIEQQDLSKKTAFLAPDKLDEEGRLKEVDLNTERIVLCVPELIESD